MAASAAFTVLLRKGSVRGYRSLGPAESEGGIERNELIFERML